jgi:hypothetical protein
LEVVLVDVEVVRKPVCILKSLFHALARDADAILGAAPEALGKFQH